MKLALSTVAVLSALSIGLATNAVADQNSEVDTSSNYMMCKRDGRMGAPAESYACMEKHLKDSETACSGAGDNEICATSYYSLCKQVGEAANVPVNDQGAKGAFPDGASCMAKCAEEERIWGKAGGKCLGDITPR